MIHDYVFPLDLTHVYCISGHIYGTVLNTSTAIRRNVLRISTVLQKDSTADPPALVQNLAPFK